MNGSPSEFIGTSVLKNSGMLTWLITPMADLVIADKIEAGNIGQTNVLNLHPEIISLLAALVVPERRKE